MVETIRNELSYAWRTSSSVPENYFLRWDSFGLVSNLARNTLLPPVVTAQSINSRVFGAGWDAAARANRLATKGLQTIDKPTPETPDTFLAAWISMSNEFIHLNAVRPFNRAGVHNYYGLAASGLIQERPFVMKRHEDDLPLIRDFLNPASELIDAVTGPTGYWREWPVIRRASRISGWSLHHNDATFFDPQPAGFVYQSYLNNSSYCARSVIDSAGNLTIANAATGLSINPTMVLIQNGRVLMHPPVAYSEQGGPKRVNGSFTNLNIYRAQTGAGGAGASPDRFMLFNQSIWIDVTDLPDVAEVEVDFSEDGPAALFGIGFLFDALYGQNYAANARAYNPVLSGSVTDLLYRVSDDDVRRVYNAMMADGVSSGGPVPEPEDPF